MMLGTDSATELPSSPLFILFVYVGGIVCCLGSSSSQDYKPTLPALIKDYKLVGD